MARPADSFAFDIFESDDDIPPVSTLTSVQGSLDDDHVVPRMRAMGREATPEPEYTPAPAPAPVAGNIAFCAICLMSILVGTLQSELNCGHTFHTECLSQLVASIPSGSRSPPTARCPLCRVPITRDEVRLHCPHTHLFLQTGIFYTI